MPHPPSSRRALKAATAFRVLPCLLVVALLPACAGAKPAPPAPITVEVPVTREVVVERVVTATPPARPAASSRVSVCVLQEPNSLNPFVSDLPAARAAREAIYDGLIDSLSYQHQAVALRKLPSIRDGDASVETVEVGIGDRVYDLATGSIVEIGEGSRVTLMQAAGAPIEADFADSPVATAVQVTARWTQVPGLTWQDGVPVTSQDALLAFAVASSPAAPLRPDFTRYTAAYEAVNETTVRWVGLPGYTSETYFLHHAGFLPAHTLGHMSPEEILADAHANHQPLAYGPFKLEEWLPGELMRFVRNPSYWRAAEGLPLLDELIIRFVPDTARIVSQIVSGRCDLALDDSALAEQLGLIRQLEAEGVLIAHVLPANAFDQLSFNAQPAAGAGFAATARTPDGAPVFADQRVRQAIVQCLDRETIIAQALNGAGVLQHTYAPPDHPLYAGDERVTTYAFDPAAGRALLAAAGWEDTNGDGIVDNADGQKFTVYYSTRASAARQAVTRLVQQQLRANCGIELVVELLGSEYTEPGPHGLALGRRFDLSQLAFRHGGEPLCSLYLSSAIPSEANGWQSLNLTGYANPEFDQACQEAYQATDLGVKAAKHAEAQWIWSNDLPAIILYAPIQLTVARPGLANLLPNSTAASGLWNIEYLDWEE
jgi:peptide/nickel transport system substrate-binding protein